MAFAQVDYLMFFVLDPRKMFHMQNVCSALGMIACLTRKVTVNPKAIICLCKSYKNCYRIFLHSSLQKLL